MAKKTTVLSVSSDFALAEAMERHAISMNLQRSDAMRLILRKALGVTGADVKPRPPLPWVTVEEGGQTVWMFDGGPGCWAIVRCAPNTYPRLTIEEPGCPTYSKQLCYSPDEYCIYLAEGIILDRWPQLSEQEIPVNVDMSRTASADMAHEDTSTAADIFSPVVFTTRPQLQLVSEAQHLDVLPLVTPGKGKDCFNNRAALKAFAVPPSAQQIGLQIDADIVEAVDDFCDTAGISRSEAIRRALWHVYGHGGQGEPRPCLQWIKTSHRVPDHSCWTEDRWTLEIGDGRRAQVSCINHGQSTLTLSEPGIPDAVSTMNGHSNYVLWRATGKVLKLWPDIESALRSAGKVKPAGELGYWAVVMEEVLRAA